ncbi:MAG: hypothetical protein IJL38_01810 [Bacteroidales bacterium]|nr:hypothetical protein [Bacteroidales bacterium]
MDKKVFNSMVAEPTVFTYQDKVEIQEERVRAPYSSLLQVMDLLSEKACGVMGGGAEARVALYLSPSQSIEAMLAAVKLKEERVVPAAAEPKKEEKKEEKRKEDATEVDILQEINDYQEISLKTAPKSVILDKFLEVTPRRDEDMEDDGEESLAEMGKKSIQPNKGLETETLATILERQGRYDKAIVVYVNLMAREPEKKEKYEARIAELKNKIAELKNKKESK